MSTQNIGQRLTEQIEAFLLAESCLVTELGTMERETLRRLINQEVASENKKETGSAKQPWTVRHLIGQIHGLFVGDAKEPLLRAKRVDVLHKIADAHNIAAIVIVALILSGCCGEGVDFIPCLIHTPVKVRQYHDLSCEP